MIKNIFQIINEKKFFFYSLNIIYLFFYFNASVLTITVYKKNYKKYKIIVFKYNRRKYYLFKGLTLLRNF